MTNTIQQFIEKMDREFDEKFVYHPRDYMDDDVGKMVKSSHHSTLIQFCEVLEGEIGGEEKYEDNEYKKVAEMLDGGEKLQVAINSSNEERSRILSLLKSAKEEIRVDTKK